MRIYQMQCAEAVYRAAEGDTFAGIAEKFGTLAENVAECNGGVEPLDGDLVFIPNLDYTLYTAQPLDTVGGIMNKFGVGPQDILPAGLDSVYVGQRLLVKTGGLFAIDN
ncbi:MAG: LysM peptidoglycan-binding domain-containing protein [Clostridiales bacterium]|jgi:LysM repeat protein|nr:LysM peptidoglycan-binding domain-containing protein [Clostridiales bacterium]